jgi:hypothetical protein
MGTASTKLHVKDLASNKTTDLDVKESDTVGNVKLQIQEKEGIPVDQQVLSFADKHLENDDATLKDIGNQNDCTIILGHKAGIEKLTDGSFVLYTKKAKIKAEMKLGEQTEKLLEKLAKIVEEAADPGEMKKLLKEQDGMTKAAVGKMDEAQLRAVVKNSKILKIKPSQGAFDAFAKDFTALQEQVQGIVSNKRSFEEFQAEQSAARATADEARETFERKQAEELAKQNIKRAKFEQMQADALEKKADALKVKLSKAAQLRHSSPWIAINVSAKALDESGMLVGGESAGGAQAQASTGSA